MLNFYTMPQNHKYHMVQKFMAINFIQCVYIIHTKSQHLYMEVLIKSTSASTLGYQFTDFNLIILPLTIEPYN